MKENQSLEKHRAKGRVAVVTSTARDIMMNQVVALLYKCTSRQKIEEHILSYGYSNATLKDLIAEATHLAAKKITKDEAELAKQQIKQLSETIMNDEDEFSMARIKAGELLGKLMRVFNPEIAIQQNTTNNLNFSELTPEQIKEIMEVTNNGSH